MSRDPRDYRPGQLAAHPVVSVHSAADLYAANGTEWPVSGDHTTVTENPPRASHGYRVHYVGPTDTKGARWSVLFLQTGRRQILDYTSVMIEANRHRSDNMPRMAVQIAHRGPVTYIGEDSRGSYYVGE